MANSIARARHMEEETCPVCTKHLAGARMQMLHLAGDPRPRTKLTHTASVLVFLGRFIQTQKHCRRWQGLLLHTKTCLFASQTTWIYPGPVDQNANTLFERAADCFSPGLNLPAAGSAAQLRRVTGHISDDSVRRHATTSVNFMIALIVALATIVVHHGNMQRYLQI